MDDSQNNHLKAYGIAYWVLEQQQALIGYSITGG